MASTNAITGVFIAIIFFICAIILFLTTVFQVNSLLLLPIIWILVLFGAITLKAVVISGDRELGNKDWRDISLSSFISVFLIVGSTLLYAQPTIIGRAFENTVGYWWINGDLTDVANGVFVGGTTGNYNIIATQLFSNNFDTYLGNMTADNESNPFKGITANIGSAEPLRLLINKKYNVSKGMLASLATIVAFYTSYMPIVSPWINI